MENYCDYQDIPYSFRGRSLVNRRGDGSIKFSHKSFWEFFLAINSIENAALTIENATLVPVKTTMLGAIKRSIVRLYKRIA